MYVPVPSAWLPEKIASTWSVNNLNISPSIFYITGSKYLGLVHAQGLWLISTLGQCRALSNGVRLLHVPLRESESQVGLEGTIEDFISVFP